MVFEGVLGGKTVMSLDDTVFLGVNSNLKNKSWQRLVKENRIKLIFM